MPYIPWAQYGICKFWMLKRCYGGDKCHWKHPSPAERRRLWDEKTAEQDVAAANGVPRPINPRLVEAKQDKPVRTDDTGHRRVERDGGEARAYHYSDDRVVRPPPPPPPALPPMQQQSNESPSMHHGFQDPTTFEGRALDEYNRRDLPSAQFQPAAAPEVSMLDAPDSPTVTKPEDPESRPAERSIVSSHHGVGPFLVDRMALDGASSPGPVTIWRRDDDATSRASGRPDNNLFGTGSDHTPSGKPEKSSYWTQYRERRNAMSKKRGESAKEAQDEMSERKASASSNLTAAPTRKAEVETSRQRARKATATGIMGATKRMSNGEVKHVGPHPSTIRVSARYASQASLDKKLQPQPPTATQTQPDVQERLTAEAREDSIRLQGCRWIDDVRRQMQLPIRTFTTACTYYHKFRLAHPQHVAGMEYGNAWADACAASLLTACKVEDTLKKSKDILAAAHNLRAATTGGEQVGSDDAMFEAPSRVVIGLERLVLEAGSFDFRSKYPHELMVKIAKTLKGDEEEKRAITSLAWSVLTDLHRTFAPLKQTSASMAVASLELASHLYAAGTSNDSSAVRDNFAEFNYEKHSTSREEVMETILDALDLYTHHTLQTLLGSKYSLDDYLRIRLTFNKECSENSLPRFTLASPRETEQEPNGNTLRVQNGHPTPVSPPQPEAQTQAQQQQPNAQPTPENGGTLRFMLNPQLAADEKSEVQKYFTEEWEEYEEEIEVPIPRAPSPDRGSDRSDRRPPLTGSPRALPPGPPRSDYRGRYDDRRPPPPPRYDDRRYDDRRYDDRRMGRYDDRRYDDRRRDRR